MEAQIIQFDLFEPDDSMAYVFVGGKWRHVPFWVWCELEGDGIKSILQNWQGGLLMKYYPPNVVKMIDMGTAMPDIEDEVLNSICKQAKALRRYLRGNYRNELTALENRVKELDIAALDEHPVWKPVDRYQWIANVLSSRGDKYTVSMVKSLLDRASEIILISYETELEIRLAKSLKLIRQYWLEISNKTAKIA